MPDYIPLENDLERVVNNAPLIIFQIDKNGIFTLSEGASLKILGLQPGQVVGQSIFELYKDYPLIINNIKKVLREGVDSNYVVAITEKLFFETKVSPVIKNGEIVGVNGVSTDISEQKFLEKQLKYSEEQYRYLIETAPFGIMIIQGMETKYVNKKFAEIFGYEKPEDFSSNLKLTFFASKVRENIYQRFLRRLKGSNEPRTYETIGLTKDGREFPLKINIENINYFGKSALMAFFEDISNQKKAEEQNQLIMKQIMETQKLESLGILAGGIAHDFNNLLVGILGYSSLVLSKIDPDSPIYDYMIRIEKSSKLASDLTKQMLNYSGKGQFQKELVNLKDLIEENLPLFKSSVSKTHELNIKIEEELPFVEIDTTQIRQVILNVLINASESIRQKGGKIAFSITKQYIQAGEIFTTAHTQLNQGLYAVLEVQDNGKGIPPEIVQRIFDPFFTTKTTGRGLGLAVVHGIIKGHNGGIKVNSEIDKGTNIKIYLPSVEGTNLKKETQNKKLVSELVPGTVLICDDEEIVIDVASKMFSDLGYNTMVAHDGNETINMYTKHQKRLDLVLLDLTMPKLNGNEAFYKIREINPSVKIILSSGFSEKEVMVKYHGLKNTTFLQKPYSFQDLINKINEVNN